MVMTPTSPADPRQRIDQTYQGGRVVDEVIHAWPEDGTAIHRFYVGDQVATENLTGLPIPVVPGPTPAEIADQLATQAALSIAADTRALADGLAALADSLREGTL